MGLGNGKDLAQTYFDLSLSCLFEPTPSNLPRYLFVARSVDFCIAMNLPDRFQVLVSFYLIALVSIVSSSSSK